MNDFVDLRLHLITDRNLCASRRLEDIVLAAVRGGVSIVQLREKNIETCEFIELARSLRALLKKTGVPLLINDRVDVALAVQADGVHIGQKDMPYTDARRLLGSKAIIGLSVENMEQIQSTQGLEGIDYLGIGPIFATQTKQDAAPPLGLDGLAQAKKLTTIPLVAIGGIDEYSAAKIVESGADGLAVVSALCAAPNPQKTAQQFIASFE